ALHTRPRSAAADRGLRLFRLQRIRCVAQATRRKEVFVRVFIAAVRFQTAGWRALTRPRSWVRVPRENGAVIHHKLAQWIERRLIPLVAGSTHALVTSLTLDRGM